MLATVILLPLAFGSIASLHQTGQWRIDPSPILVVAGGRQTEAFSFHEPVAAVRLPNATVMVADAHLGSILFFDDTGRPPRRIGRPGDGPGEFRHVLWVARCGQSLLAYDQMRQVMIELSFEGVLDREFRIPQGEAGTAIPFSLSCFGENITAYQSISRPAQIAGSSPGIDRGTAPIVILDSLGHRVGTIDGLPATETVTFGGGGGPRPLGKSTIFAIGAGRVYVGTSDSAFIQVYSIDGRPMGGIVAGIPGRTATNESYASAVEDIVASVRGTRMRDFVKEQLLALPRPVQVPPYRAFLVDSEEVLWVDVTLPNKQQSGIHLQAYSRDGKRLGDLRIPNLVKLTDIGYDYILGLHNGAAGSEVHMYRLHRIRHR